MYFEKCIKTEVLTAALAVPDLQCSGPPRSALTARLEQKQNECLKTCIAIMREQAASVT